MKPVFFRYFRLAAVAIFLGTHAMSGLASAMGGEWQAIVDKHALLMMQGQHQLALEEARAALNMAENAPIKNQKNVALSLFILGSTHSITHNSYGID